jgi:AcrR family transcriptional regulator
MFITDRSFIVNGVPRPRTIPDETLLDLALGIVHRDGPAGLSFGTLAADAGLAGSTLVQRFGTKAELLRRTLLRAWDLLDEATARAIAAAPNDVEGIAELFVALTATRDEDDYAEQLPVLREDLRDPILRQRGERWLATLAAAVDERLGELPPGSGRLVVAHWQGTLTVWAFTRDGPLPQAVRSAVTELLARIGAGDRRRRRGHR